MGNQEKKIFRHKKIYFQYILFEWKKLIFFQAHTCHTTYPDGIKNSQFLSTKKKSLSFDALQIDEIVYKSTSVEKEIEERKEHSLMDKTV